MAVDTNGNEEACNVAAGSVTAPVVAGGHQVGFTTAARHDARRDAALPFQPVGHLREQAAAQKRPPRMLSAPPE